MNSIRKALEGTKVGQYLDTRLSNPSLDMTVLEALSAVKETMPNANRYYLKNPLQMTFPYRGGRIASIVGNSSRDYRNPQSLGAQGINNTFDAIVQGYRQHSTRNMGIGSRYEAENLQPNTPMLIQDGSRLLLAQTPNKPSSYPWVNGAVTSKIGLGSRFSDQRIVNIEDPEVMAKWGRLENWSDDFARKYFFDYKPNELQIGMPFRIVKEIGVSPYKVKQGQVIATPVSRPIVLNSQPQPEPQVNRIATPVVTGNPIEPDIFASRPYTLPQRVSPDLGQQYLAMQDDLADLAYAAQSQYGLRDMASSYYP